MPNQARDESDSDFDANAPVNEEGGNENDDDFDDEDDGGDDGDEEEEEEKQDVEMSEAKAEEEKEEADPMDVDTPQKKALATLESSSDESTVGRASHSPSTPCLLTSRSHSYYEAKERHHGHKHCPNGSVCPSRQKTKSR